MDDQGENHKPRQQPLTSVTPSLRSRNLEKEICASEEDLPASCISQLWKQPLRLSLSSNAPAETNVKLRNHPTPTRKKSFETRIPPTKLFEEDGSNESPTSSLPIVSRSVYRRSLSHPEHGVYGTDISVVNPKRLKLFVDETSPFEEFNANKPKPKSEFFRGEGSTTLTPAVKKLFVKSQSDPKLSTTSNCSIARALDKIESNPNLIGDASKSYILPVKEDGRHPDLKEITGDTLAALLQNKEDSVSFKIIDCRYPYEYDGGHIRGALNLFTRNQIREELLDSKTAIGTPTLKPDLREILIFHCEFSSERGPKLCRYLRDIDRAVNEYPSLYFPELYILFGGYKEFFEKFPNLCDPQKYVQMTDPEHVSEYRRCKSSSKFGSQRRF